MSRVVGDDRNDLTSRMLEFCMARDAADQQRPIHHLAEHGHPPTNAL
jgi:hypothetical protein